MAKRDRKQKKRLARVQQDLDRGLRRGDAELAVRGLVAMGAGEAGAELIARVAGLVVGFLDAARDKGDLAAIDRISAHLGDAEWLLDPLDEAPRLEVAFAMVLAAARRGDAAGARAWLSRARASLSERAPGLLACLDQLVEADAEAWIEPPSHLAGLAEVAPPPAPSTPEAAEGAVLTAAAVSSSTEFERHVRAWLRDAPPPVAQAIAAAALPVVERTLVLACEAGNDAAAVDAARWLVELSRLAPAQGDVLLRGIRFGLHRLVARGRTGVMGVLVTPLLRDPTRRELVIDALASVEVAPAGRTRFVDLLERLIEVEPAPALLARVLELREVLDLRDETEVSEAFVVALESIVRNGVLVRWCTEAPLESAETLIQASVDLLPWPLGAEVIRGAVEGGGERLHAVLASATASLCERADAEPLDITNTARTATFGNLVDVLRALERLEPDDEDYTEMLAAMRRFPRERSLPPELWRGYEELRRRWAHLDGGQRRLGPRARALLQRVGDVLLPYDAHLLELMVSASRSAAEVRDLVRRHLGESPGAGAWLQALRVTDEHGWMDVHRELRDALAIEVPVPVLADLFMVGMGGAPAELVYHIARTLSHADEAYEGTRSETYEIAVMTARGLLHADEKKKRRKGKAGRARDGKTTSRGKGAKAKRGQKSTKGTNAKAAKANSTKPAAKASVTSAADASAEGYDPAPRQLDLLERLHELEQRETEHA